MVKIDLEEHLSPDVLRAVSEGATDLGICNAALPGTTHALQIRHYREDRLVLVVPRDHALAEREAIAFAEALAFDYVGLHSNSSIYLAMQQEAAARGQSVRLRIQVTGLDAMCRMIGNDLGIGVMPGRAFELMETRSALAAVAITDAWAHRHISLVARDFATLPVPTRRLADHLTTQEA